jgi:hypothetical protein
LQVLNNDTKIKELIADIQESERRLRTDQPCSLTPALNIKSA